MREIFLLLAVAGMCLTINAQDTIVIAKKTCYDVLNIDGAETDFDWSKAEKHHIDKMFIGDTIDGASDCSGYFKCAWNNTNLYIFISVTDDIHYPSGTFGETWEKDKVEVYFNMLVDDLLNGTGASSGLTSANKRGQIAPVADPTASAGDPDWLNGELVVLVDGTNYTYEMSVPWADLDATYSLVDQKVIGFDVTIVDNDGAAVHGKARRRLCWMNNGAVNENWTNMNGAGFLQIANNIDYCWESVNPKSSNEDIILTLSQSLLKAQNVKSKTACLLSITGQVLKISNVYNSEVSFNIGKLPKGIYLFTAGNALKKIVLN